ncbi:nitrilase-related carbon-nitrogen hydrolase [Fibrobacter sp. UWH4]|uniref:nitrilase-related carbon-nitrogen hydrolase n=1 Tax=Fibrobacter sp. UWH4 TaxID=1896210 RepID=UPI00090F7BA3|nr:nitrilase-related carbon-nitrogen hydrolase [Fibrobacter sp. UWH4]SHK65177.1 Predicted amidohydrolase [Fibrobacter sp. UWH4]
MLDIYLVQMEIVPNDKAKNFAKVRELSSKIRKNADDSVPGLIILPEMFATGYLPLHPESAAEHFFKNDAGETADFLYKLANETGCAVMGAGIEKGAESDAARDTTENQKLLNHCSVYQPGYPEEFAAYDKYHPFFMEQKKFKAGGMPCPFSLYNWTVASTICFDLRFPELYRDAVKAGARLITVQAAWPAARIAHWKTLLQARAIENQVYIAAVNGIGGPSYGGNSMIINPKGEIIASTDASFEGIVHARIDSKSQEEYRKQFPVLKGIVPEEYI